MAHVNIPYSLSTLFNCPAMKRFHIKHRYKYTGFFKFKQITYDYTFVFNISKSTKHILVLCFPKYKLGCVLLLGTTNIKDILGIFEQKQIYIILSTVK